MIWRAEHHQFVITPVHHFQVRVPAFALDQTQVEFKVGHLAHDGLGIGHLQLYPSALLLTHVPRHDLDCQVVTDTQRSADAQMPGALMSGQGLLQTARLIQQRLCARTDAGTQRIKLQALAYPVEQLHVKLAFQILQRAAGCRLRHREAGSGAGQVFVMRRGQKNLKLPQGIFHNRFYRIAI